MEEWKDIAGYDGVYQISSLGRVRSRWKQMGRGRGNSPLWFVSKSWKILKPGYGPYGHAHVVLKKPGATKVSQKRISVLVLETFVSKKPDGMECCHGPNGTRDNSVTNLSWGTAKKNQYEDKLRDGTHNRGERHGMSKLTRGQVIEIRKMISNLAPRKNVAEKFKISIRTVRDIISGRRWSWLK